MWNSAIPGAIRNWDPSGESIPDADPVPGVWCGSVPLPEAAWPLLGEGARLDFTVRGRR